MSSNYFVYSLYEIESNDPTLKCLNLGGNPIGDEGAKDIAKALNINSRLKKTWFILSSNRRQRSQGSSRITEDRLFEFGIP